MTEPIVASSTTPGQNRFEAKFYVLKMDGGLLLPSRRAGRGLESFRVRLTLEYPLYEEEVQARQNFTNFIEKWGVTSVNYDLVEAWRVQRCLVSWNLPELLSWVHPVQRMGNNMVVDQTMHEWRRLPPLLRKQVASEINRGLGPI